MPLAIEITYSKYSRLYIFLLKIIFLNNKLSIMVRLLILYGTIICLMTTSSNCIIKLEFVYIVYTIHPAVSWPKFIFVESCLIIRWYTYSVNKSLVGRKLNWPPLDGANGDHSTSVFEWIKYPVCLQPQDTIHTQYEKKHSSQPKFNQKKK